MYGTRSPKEIALASHRDYYAGGSYDSDRLSWTLKTFLSSSNPGKVLEIGCGDGAMLQLLAERNIDAVGVDASASGINRCTAAGLSAQCLDVSTDGVPFPDDSFDIVISLETFEHLMNPHYALQEVRRTLRSGGRFLCSIPNPRTGHPYLYPGLFEYKNFRRFLEQTGFNIRRVEYWQWAPRETILPLFLRHIPILNGRMVAGGIRRLVEKSYRTLGAFPALCYWLWTFDCYNTKSSEHTPFEQLSEKTRPGSTSHFAPPR
jgi:SAM-dependent methyltransferase